MRFNLQEGEARSLTKLAEHLLRLLSASLLLGA